MSSETTQTILSIFFYELSRVKLTVIIFSSFIQLLIPNSQLISELCCYKSRGPPSSIVSVKEQEKLCWINNKSFKIWKSTFAKIERYHLTLRPSSKNVETTYLCSAESGSKHPFSISCCFTPYFPLCCIWQQHITNTVNEAIISTLIVDKNHAVPCTWPKNIFDCLAPTLHKTPNTFWICFLIFFPVR